MKKLMVMAAAVVAAVVVNASTVNWSSTGFLYDGATTPAKVATEPAAYLMIYSTTFDQTALVSAFAAANGDVTKTLKAMTDSKFLAAGDNSVTSAAKLTGTSTYTMTSDLTAYIVVFDHGDMFISNTGTMAYTALNDTANGSAGSISTISKNTYQAADGYSNAGWYAVPEPTSGLLLLVGGALLALRRRRA